MDRDGTMGGTRINPVALDSLLLRGRVFDQRYDTAVSVETMTGHAAR